MAFVYMQFNCVVLWLIVLCVVEFSDVECNSSPACCSSVKMSVSGDFELILVVLDAEGFGSVLDLYNVKITFIMTANPIVYSKMIIFLQFAFC